MSRNEWPQTHIDEQRTVLMASTALLMDKTAQEQQRQQQQQTGQQPLKCPRCDSSNTKFCYYNNYSLSQPRHFCKSCKRYWTRGGTLRNVPVGGGCRKNKRLRRPSCATRILEAATPPHSSSSSAVLAPTNHNPPVLPQIDLNPIFYGLPTNAPEFPFSGRFSDLTSSTAGYELSHSPAVSGVGFSSDSSNPISPIFGSFSSSAATPTIASLLASTFIPQKLVNKTASRVGSFQALAAPLHQQDQLQMSRENSNDIKVEQGQWNNISGCQNPMEPQAGLSDPFMFWNVTNSSSTIGASQFLL